MTQLTDRLVWDKVTVKDRTTVMVDAPFVGICGAVHMQDNAKHVFLPQEVTTFPRIRRRGNLSCEASLSCIHQSSQKERPDVFERLCALSSSLTPPKTKSGGWPRRCRKFNASFLFLSCRDASQLQAMSLRRPTKTRGNSRVFYGLYGFTREVGITFFGWMKRPTMVWGEDEKVLVVRFLLC